MAALQTHVFSCLSDNYGVLVHAPDTGETAAIDVPEAAPVLAALKETGWQLTEIWITHHHQDHVGGLAEVKAGTGAKVRGPAAEAGTIDGLDETLPDGAGFDFAGRPVRVIETPGHTLGHICYWIEQDGLLFAADTLFVMGCGRVLEGTHEQMWRSLSALAALPPHTQVFCGHEYTLANARFALGVDAGNAELGARAKAMEERLGQGQPTIPTTIEAELKTNPFLRAGEPALAEAVGMAGADAASVFGELRERKNRG